jgi:hypothetical protein
MAPVTSELSGVNNITVGDVSVWEMASEWRIPHTGCEIGFRFLRGFLQVIITAKVIILTMATKVTKGFPIQSLPCMEIYVGQVKCPLLFSILTITEMFHHILTKPLNQIAWKSV